MKLMRMAKDGGQSGRGGWVRVVVWLLVLAGTLGVAVAVERGRQGSPADADELDLVPWEMGMERGSELARESGKPMFVNFTADWCLGCQEMKATVFSQPHVAETISEHFVPVKVDMTAPEPGSPEERAAVSYGVVGYPTYLVVAPDGQPVSGRLGSGSEEALLSWLDAVR